MARPEIAEKYYDSALVTLNLELLGGSANPFIHGYLGIGYAGKMIEAKAIEEGKILADFDARTGHNHGTKFRLKQDSWKELYSSVVQLF